jgi:hypothetical protein
MMKKGLLAVFLVLAGVGGTALAVNTVYRAAVIYGSASSWLGATGHTTGHGTYWKTDNHLWAHHDDGTESIADSPAVGTGGGTVTGVSTSAGLTGGPITSSGTIGIDYTYSPTWTGTHTFANFVLAPGMDAGAPGPVINGQSNATWWQIGTNTHPIGLGVNMQPTYGLHILGGGGRYQTINQPSGVAVVAQGTTGATSWAYYIVAVDAFGNRTQASSTISIANGNATLTSTNNNLISWNAGAGAACFDIVRTTAGGTPNTTGAIAFCTQTTSFNDVGLNAFTYTTPSRNATGDLVVDGQLTVSANINGPLSITGPVTINGGNNHTTGNWLIDGTFQPSRTTFGDANFTITGVSINAITASLTAPRVASVSCNLGSTTNPVKMEIKDEAGGATGTNTITITPTAGTIDGSASKVCINSAFGSCRFYARGGNCYTD